MVIHFQLGRRTRSYLRHDFATCGERNSPLLFTHADMLFKFAKQVDSMLHNNLKSNLSFHRGFHDWRNRVVEYHARIVSHKHYRSFLYVRVHVFQYYVRLGERNYIGGLLEEDFFISAVLEVLARTESFIIRVSE